MKGQKGTTKVVAAETTTDKSTTEKTAKEEAEKAAAEGIQSAEELAEWASLWSGVGEEMAWATTWIPFWEVDAYDALYGDVLWDYDIWNLKSITNPPDPSQIHNSNQRL